MAKRQLLGDARELHDLAGVDSLLRDLVRQRRVPGLACTLTRQGKTILQQGYGYARLETQARVKPGKTLFRAASVSKPIAATALLKMVAEGIIDLDASLYDYIPYFPRKRHDFTIRQLAAHTAGIRGYRGREFGLNRAYSIRDSLVLFKDDPLLFKPGTAYHYNSFGWVLISLAMEEASGIPFADYTYTKVLQPLGMTHTMPENSGLRPDGMAAFYTKSAKGFRPAPLVNNLYKLAGGGYLTTTADMARLGNAYLEGEIGTPALVSQFLGSMYIDDTPTYYGLGWEVSRDAHGHAFFGHTGNSVGAYSKLMVFPESQTVLALLVNCTKPGIETQVNEISALLHGVATG